MGGSGLEPETAATPKPRFVHITHLVAHSDYTILYCGILITGICNYLQINCAYILHVQQYKFNLTKST